MLHQHSAGDAVCVRRALSVVDQSRLPTGYTMEKADGKLMVKDSTGTEVAYLKLMPSGSIAAFSRTDCLDMLPMFTDHVKDWQPAGPSSLVATGNPATKLDLKPDDWVGFVSGLDNRNPLKTDMSPWPLFDNKAEEPPPQEGNGSQPAKGEPKGEGQGVQPKAEQVQQAVEAIQQEGSGKQTEAQEAEAESEQAETKEGDASEAVAKDDQTGDAADGDGSSGGGGKPPPQSPSKKQDKEQQGDGQGGERPPPPRIGEAWDCTFDNKQLPPGPHTVLAITEQRCRLQRWSDGLIITVNRDKFATKPIKGVTGYGGEELDHKPNVTINVSSCPDGYRFLAIGEKLRPGLLMAEVGTDKSGPHYYRLTVGKRKWRSMARTDDGKPEQDTEETRKKYEKAFNNAKTTGQVGPGAENKEGKAYRWPFAHYVIPVPPQPKDERLPVKTVNDHDMEINGWKFRVEFILKEAAA